GSRNVISGNTGDGVLISGAGTSQNLVVGNIMGADRTGSIAVPNTQDGVAIMAGASQNTIGGGTASLGNTIAFNQGSGVGVTGSTSTANIIRANSIFANTGIGIDLGDDGQTPNDSQGHTGPNNFQNFPTLLSTTPGTGLAEFVGTLQSQPNALFTIDF